MQQVAVMYETVQQLMDRVRQAQDLVEKVVVNMDDWCSIPLYQRKEEKKENLLSLENRFEIFHHRKQHILATSAEFQNVVVTNYVLFMNVVETPEEEEEEVEEEEEPDSPEKQKKKKGKGVEKEAESKDAKGKGKAKDKKPKPKKVEVEKTESEILREQEEIARKEEEIRKRELKDQRWLEYLDYLDSLIVRFLNKAISVSLVEFQNEMGNVTPVLPFIEAIMELHETKIVFIPSADIEETDSLYTLFQNLMGDMYAMSHFIYRVKEAHKNFLEFVEEDDNNLDKYRDILAKVAKEMDSAMGILKEFEEYAPLWNDDRQEYLRQVI